MITLNSTHDANLTSWVTSANGHSDFPIQNLPFASFRIHSNEAFRGGVAIGDSIVDLAALASTSLLSGLAQQAAEAAAKPQLNEFMQMGQPAWSALRAALSQLLSSDNSERLPAHCLQLQSQAHYQMPCHVGDYTDFYTSIHHATAVGSLFRPDNPLLPNYKWVPIGYHGRASSLDVSGQAFHRPSGQTKAPDASTPSFGPCKRLDYELEMGIFIGQGNEFGHPIDIDDSHQHVFGMCLFNDWSARDIQAWEYQPLGPFLSKSFASTISPWIVTMEALAPYRSQYLRPESDPTPLPYLCSDNNDEFGSMDIELECFIQTETMRAAGEAPQRLSRSNFRHSYWTIAQMVAHHSVNGCNLRAGDLLGSGTQSGPEAEEAGSLLELSKGGKQAITLANGEQRSFLADGDTITFRGHCERQGFVRIGFGQVESTVLPAKS
ncbi:fumarylacetoacetase [Paraferrimonas haliotis]|uniref:fumarylacetoacetase n=1 Tax=Paraferrimonas haliotis TaxID=2013866 RepID=A0AA37TIS2_9GAMM|nr:fumarylacetoacetase [Paraferrimonas haliotis]GLS82132.1 fumarylacetoacetase [Paraferrimonas haliotis]